MRRTSDPEDPGDWCCSSDSADSQAPKQCEVPSECSVSLQRGTVLGVSGIQDTAGLKVCRQGVLCACEVVSDRVSCRLYVYPHHRASGKEDSLLCPTPINDTY